MTAMTPASPQIVWFRQDLRLQDQAAFAEAAARGPVIPVYVLDDQGWYYRYSHLQAFDPAIQPGVKYLRPVSVNMPGA